MRRLVWLAVLCGALLLAAPASASATAREYVFDSGERNVCARCVDYEGELPAEVQIIFSDVQREGDRILAASRRTEWWKSKNAAVSDTILLAVEREGCILLIGAFYEESGWAVCVETDSFLPHGTAFTITCLPEDGQYGGVFGARQAIVCGDECWQVCIERGGWIRLCALATADGERPIIGLDMMSLFTISDGQESDWKSGRCCAPSRLAAWRAEEFPRSAEEIARYVQAHQPRPSQGEAYISSVNLREEPTGSSRSLGVYSAKVQVLDSSPSREYPWYRVRIGDTEGWVSGAYVLESSEDLRYYGVEEATTSFVRADREIALYMSPGGAQKGALSPGTVAYVLAENEGWLHVLVPQGDITPRVSWEGTYGYVKADGVTQGKTLAELRWK